MVEVVEMMVEDISHLFSFFSLLISLILLIFFLFLFFCFEISEECNKGIEEFLGFMKRVCNKCEV